MNKSYLKAIIILICVSLISIALFIENIGISIKIMLFILYCFFVVFLFIKEKKYCVFNNKFINILYCIIYLYFPISIWYFVFFQIQNTFYNLIDAIACLSFIGFSIAKSINDF